MPKILIVSNRFLDTSCSDENTFGPGFNSYGPCELRVAQAAYREDSGRWSVSLLPEDYSTQDYCQSSRFLFQQIVADINSGMPDAQNWVVFIPGYCSPLKEGLDKSLELLKAHQTNVILFSWPSDPRLPAISPIDKYFRTQEAATLSASALVRAIEGINRVLIQPARAISGNRSKFSVNLLAHSLGSHVVQHYINLASPHSGDLSMFDNVILHQPDVNFAGHSEWVKRIRARAKSYITTNKFDEILKNVSNLVNPTRLGQISSGAVSVMPDVLHVDFAEARNVNNQHWFFGDFENNVIQMFCTKVLHGEPGEVALYQDPSQEGRYQCYAPPSFPPFPGR